MLLLLYLAKLLCIELMLDVLNILLVMGYDGI